MGKNYKCEGGEKGWDFLRHSVRCSVREGKSCGLGF